MKKILFFFLIFFLFFSNNLHSEEKVINILKEGGNIVFIRHAYAPGNGDPKDFNLSDCLTQRNLSIDGINQSKKIGFFFEKNEIKIDQVLSSQWCRCKDTAKFAFKEYKTFNALNSFYDSRFAHNKSKQIKDLKKMIKNWDRKKNLIFITHYVVIYEILNIPVSSGEIVVSDINFNILGNIEINN